MTAIHSHQVKHRYEQQDARAFQNRKDNGQPQRINVGARAGLSDGCLLARDPPAGARVRQKRL